MAFSSLMNDKRLLSSVLNGIEEKDVVIFYTLRNVHHSHRDTCHNVTENLVFPIVAGQPIDYWDCLLYQGHAIELFPCFFATCCTILYSITVSYFFMNFNFYSYFFSLVLSSCKPCPNHPACRRADEPPPQAPLMQWTFIFW